MSNRIKMFPHTLSDVSNLYYSERQRELISFAVMVLNTEDSEERAWGFLLKAWSSENQQIRATPPSATSSVTSSFSNSSLID